MERHAPSISEQAAYYDRSWTDRDYANAIGLARAAAILDAVVATGLAQSGPIRSIDLGCGFGWLTAILGQFGPAVGVDLSPKGVESAAERYPFAEFRCEDLTSWQGESGYDLAVSQEVLEHFTGRDQVGHVRLAYRLLRPGAYFVLTTPNAETLGAMPRSQEWSAQPIETWRTRGEVSAMLVGAGFRLASMTTIVNGHGGGMRRILNSPKLGALAGAVGIGAVVPALQRRLGHGLHILAVAQRPNTSPQTRRAEVGARQ